MSSLLSFPRRRFLAGAGAAAAAATTLAGTTARAADRRDRGRDLGRARTISIFHTTDLHGRILPTSTYEGLDDVGGLARCATCIRQWRRESPHSITVDVGDVVQVPADDVESLASLMAQHSDTLAAVLVEPVQGAGGIYPPAEGYLESVRRLCDQHGAYLMFDEVISGYGRLGHWFAAHRFGVRPDLVTFAKAVTSGYQPLGGVFVGPAPRAALEADPDFFLRHGFTYSGHASACAAALANLAIIRHEGLLERALHVGARLRDGLQALASDGVIDHTRGDGAMWAAGLHPHQNSVALRDAMLRGGVITRAINADTLTFCPPLVITDEQIDRIVDTLAEAAR
jgi:adenosylmethionine-8-amino-7-oxononanoate aminotransferase